MNTAHNLRDFQTFGSVAAEDDAVLEYFLSTNAVENIENNTAFVVLGRKGTGKTAIVRHFTEGNAVQLSKSLNLRGYPWNIHAAKVDHGASDIEAYVSSWKYLIAVELTSLILTHPKSSLSIHSKNLAKFLNDNYGGSAPRLTDILRPVRLTLGKASVEPTIMGNKLGAIEFNRAKGDHQFGLELNALSSAIIESVFDVSREIKAGVLRLHFDELDQGLSEFDDTRKKMLIGLILAAREVRREAERAQVAVNPIIYIRNDLWDELQFSDKNKISQSLALHLEWSPDSLKDLVTERLKARLSSDARWEDIIDPQLMRGSQPKWNHITSRGFLRPRDAISFLNSILAQAKRRSDNPLVLLNKDIVDAREEYSAYLKKELDDEIDPHWELWGEALRACSAISTVTFERREFFKAYSSVRTPKNNVDADDALSILYRFSVIGYERRSGYGGKGWAYQYTDPEAGWDTGASRFKVHLGLKEYAKLRETRQ